MSAGRRRVLGQASIAPVDIDGEPHLLVVATDISELRELTERLSYQASHDALTDLCNRREFERRLEDALHRAREPATHAVRAALHRPGPVQADQRHLRPHGRRRAAGAAGAARCASSCARGDVLARLGGDEFGVLASTCDARGRALRWPSACASASKVSCSSGRTAPTSISASIGVVMVDRRRRSLRELLAWPTPPATWPRSAAATACTCIREDDETTRRRGEMEWASRLRWAIANRTACCSITRRSSRCAGSGEGAHFELLMRLRDEDGGWCRPAPSCPPPSATG